MTPLIPNSPQRPVFGGKKGCQFEGTTNGIAATITSRMIPIFVNVIAAFTVAESLTLRMAMRPARSTMAAAGRSTKPPDAHRARRIGRQG